MWCCPEHSYNLLMFGGGSGVSWQKLSSWPNPQSAPCPASRSMTGCCRPRGMFQLRAPSPDLNVCHALLDRKIQPQLSSSQPCLAIIGRCACSLIKTNAWPWLMLCVLVKALLGKMSSPPSGTLPAPHHLAPHPLGMVLQPGFLPGCRGQKLSITQVLSAQTSC